MDGKARLLYLHGMNSTASLTAAHCANPDTVSRLTAGQPVNSVCASAWRPSPGVFKVKRHMAPEVETFADAAAALARVAALNAHLTAAL